MTRIVSKTVYEFDELSDKAKEKARQWFREAQAGDNYFSESVIEDAVRIAELMGLLIRTPKNTPHIFWSGFWSQGDGACFEGLLRPKDGVVDAVKAYAPQDTELARIAGELAGFKGECVISHRGRYCHEMTMQFEFDYPDAPECFEPSEKGEEKIREALRDFARWIYRQLEKEYEYVNADEQVDESIRINQYEFHADGSKT